VGVPLSPAGPAFPGLSRALLPLAAVALAGVTVLAVLDGTGALTTGARALNRPGMSVDSVPWKGWGHVRDYVEEVPGRAA